MDGMIKRIKQFLISQIQKKLGIYHSPVPFYTKDAFSDKKFEIGEYTYGVPTVLFENENATLKIGKYCSIAKDVTIFLGGNHRHDWTTTYPFNALNKEFPFASHITGHPSTNGDVLIGNDVWIGYGATIMSGVTISDGAVIAAGSIVSKNIGSYEIWGGNPARLIKKRFSEEVISKLIILQWWNKDADFIEENIDELCDSPEKLIVKLKL